MLLWGMFYNERFGWRVRIWLWEKWDGWRGGVGISSLVRVSDESYWGIWCLYYYDSSINKCNWWFFVVVIL